jgi:hypothetical protein
MPTKDELEQENQQLRDRVHELEGQGNAAAPGTMHNTEPPRPKRPGYLSAGERDDLVNAGVTTSPFNGEEINALDEGVEPGNPEARLNAERAQERRRKRNAAAADDAAAE